MRERVLERVRRGVVGLASRAQESRRRGEADEVVQVERERGLVQVEGALPPWGPGRGGSDPSLCCRGRRRRGRPPRGSRHGAAPAASPARPDACASSGSRDVRGPRGRRHHASRAPRSRPSPPLPEDVGWRVRGGGPPSSASQAGRPQAEGARPAGHEVRRVSPDLGRVLAGDAAARGAPRDACPLDTRRGYSGSGARAPRQDRALAATGPPSARSTSLPTARGARADGLGDPDERGLGDLDCPSPTAWAWRSPATIRGFRETASPRHRLDEVEDAARSPTLLRLLAARQGQASDSGASRLQRWTTPTKRLALGEQVRAAARSRSSACAGIDREPVFARAIDAAPPHGPVTHRARPRRSTRASPTPPPSARTSTGGAPVGRRPGGSVGFHSTS